MKYLKIMILAVITAFTFGSAQAQVRVGLHIGDRSYHRRHVVVVQHRRPYHRHHEVVVVHHRY